MKELLKGENKITGWIDLRNTPEGYKPIFEYDEYGKPISLIYCPFMPIFEEDPYTVGINDNIVESKMSKISK